MFLLGERSVHRLEGVHPFIIANITLALMKYSQIDYGVGAGAVRTIQEQQSLVNNGKSGTLKSFHLPQPAILQNNKKYSHAVDLYPSGYKRIKDIPGEAWIEIKKSLRLAAEDLNTTCGAISNWTHMTIEHGLDWGRTANKLGWDCPHHQWEFMTFITRKG